MVPTTNIDIFDAINQVNYPGKATYTFCWDMTGQNGDIVKTSNLPYL